MVDAGAVCLAVSMFWCSLFVADEVAGMEILEYITDSEADLVSEKLG